jgi:hypothetical protein
MGAAGAAGNDTADARMSAKLAESTAMESTEAEVVADLVTLDQLLQLVDTAENNKKNIPAEII